MNQNTLHLIRQGDLCRMLGVSRTTIYRWELAGEFPTRVRLGSKTVAWRWHDIREWIELRGRSRRTAEGPCPIANAREE